MPESQRGYDRGIRERIILRYKSIKVSIKKDSEKTFCALLSQKKFIEKIMDIKK
jgi:hypothetical protein